MKKSLYFYILFYIFSGQLSAEDDKYAPIKDTLQTCFVCHGENGASIQTQYPIIGGQEFYYLYVQLKDMKSGLRQSPIMQPLVENMEKETMKLLAEYFSEQKWVNTDFTADAKQIAAGKKVVDAGQCVACHLGTFTGNSRVPRLANQHQEYLNKTMLDFKTKYRKNSAAKGSLFATFSDEEIKAVADYLAGFRE